MATRGGESGTAPGRSVQNTATSGIKYNPSRSFMRVSLQTNIGKRLRNAAKVRAWEARAQILFGGKLPSSLPYARHSARPKAAAASRTVIMEL